MDTLKTLVKRFILFIPTLILAILLVPFTNYGSAHGELAIADELGSAPYSKTFTISAYYSPLPCQDRYATGTYEGDIRLNGNGTNGADGTPVYPGMVAAPKTYAFGTKMEIPGIGFVAVHDRGGAIVASNTEGVYDRLDVWMGFGDVGLTRALNWGKRSVDVTVYGLTDAVEEDINLMGYTPEEANKIECGAPNANLEVPPVQSDYVKPEAPKVVPVELKVPEAPKPVSPFMTSDLKPGDSGENVVALQKNLASLNLFRGDVTGFYGEVTQHAVFKFQQINGLALDESSQYSGLFGPKTRDRMNEILASKFYVAKKLVKGSVETLEEDVAVTTYLSFGMTGQAVKDLQVFLRGQNFFDGALVTEYFGPVTKDAVIRFQLHHGIISSEADTGAGVVGPATLKVIGELS